MKFPFCEISAKVPPLDLIKKIFQEILKSTRYNSLSKNLAEIKILRFNIFTPSAKVCLPLPYSFSSEQVIGHFKNINIYNNNDGLICTKDNVLTCSVLCTLGNVNILGSYASQFLKKYM